MAKLLSWSTVADRSNSGFVAHGFPSTFKFNPADVRRGAIRVVAKAPSGQTYPMDVIENDGVYTTNFTPSEIGDWQISILFEGEHIQGSPFNVRVYDPGLVKVTGLTTGGAGQPFSFSVDTTGAGDGLLAVDISHGSRNIPVRLIPDTLGGLYKVNFTPDTGGQYTIQIYFAGLEVTGSPFTMEVVDSVDVTVSGEGLGIVPVNQQTSFLIHAPRLSTGMSALQVAITSPRGTRSSPRISDVGNGTYRVEYTPYEVGPYSIEILCHSHQIIGSPFTARGYDISRVAISGLRASYKLNDVVQFDIDVSNAGDGNLEIKVNDGTIPCSVANLGNRKYRATFTPREAKQHSIQMKFNERNVIGSPWYVDVEKPLKLSVSGTGLEHALVGKMAQLEIDTGGAVGRITSSVKGPTGRNVASNVRSSHHGVYRLEYTPVETGLHTIDIQLDGKPVPGSPFSSRVFSTAAITVSPISSAVMGSPVEFTVDVSRAGEGKLEIMVNRGSVPNTVRLLSQGVYEVSFVPRTSQPHIVNITFNGQPVPGGPITVPIIDQSKVMVSGNGIIQAAVNQKSTFHVNTQSAGNGELSAKVIALKPGGLEIPCIVRGNAVKGYDVEFITRETGDYQVRVEYGGATVQGSPFTVKSFDISKINVSGVSDGVIGQTSSFTADVENAGEGDMEISITSSGGRNIPNKVESLGAKRFHVSYAPVESGLHRANVTFNNQHVTGSPFTFHVSDISKLTASGGGLGIVPCNKVASFTVTGPSLQQKDLEISIKGPNGRPVLPQIYSTSANSVTVDYTPTSTGDYELDVKCHGHSIQGSPFLVRSWDLSKVFVSNIQPARTLQQTKFNIDASQAGFGNLEIVVSCGSDNTPNFVTADGNGHFTVSFTPLKAETHTINIKFNGEPVPGSPFSCEVIGSARLHPLSDGLVRIPNGRPATVSIDRGKGTFDSSPVVCYIVSPTNKRSSVKVTPVQGERMMKMEFSPREIGQHFIQVTVNGVEIIGSPFLCEVYDSSQVAVGRITPAIVGRLCEFDVDWSRAGSGEVEVYVKTDHGRVPVKTTDRGNGVERISFTPREPQLHHVFVHFARELVRGSPFAVDVQDVANVDAKGQGLLSAHVGKEAEFHVDPCGAPYSSDLKVFICGPVPSHQIIPYVAEGNRHDGWKVKWLPRMIGVYSIDIKYGDSHVLGSPFKCKVSDLSRIFISQDFKAMGIDVDGIPGDDVVFFVDASQAGPGNLEVVVRSAKDGSRIPNYLEADDHSGKFRIYFTPRPDCFNYQVDVAFNEEPVTGSPFYHSVLDGRRAVASGEGLGQILARRPTSFDVTTRDVGGDADLQVNVFGPDGVPVPNQVSLPTRSDFRVAYTPKAVGRYTVNVKYADVEISGSPFHPEVYDPSCVRTKDLTDGMVGKPNTFSVDTSAAGDGHVTVKVKGQTSQPYVDVTTRAPGHCVVAFEPRESGLHQVFVYFNDIQIPGSPFDCLILDADVIHAKWDSARRCPASRPIQIELEAKGSLHGKFKSKVTDPYGKTVNSRVYLRGSSNVVEYVPNEVGPHTVEVWYGSELIRGCPFTSNVYDASRVKLQDVPSTATTGQQVNFTVDTSEAGTGDVEVHVLSGNTKVTTRRDKLSEFCHHFMFMPMLPSNHVISVAFNGENVIGSPVVLKVKNPIHQLDVVNPHLQDGLVVRSLASALVETHGNTIDASDISVRITAPDGESVPSKLKERRDGKFEVEYTCKKTGRHSVEILYDNEAIRGTPFHVEVFDPNEVQIDGKSSWVLGEQAQVDVNQTNAGKADIGVVISGPRGSSVPFDVYSSSQGHRIAYTPKERGAYQIHVTYGGHSVPGCPVVHNIMDATPAVVSGPGLVKGIKDKVTTFLVDPKGNRGDLVVQVDGPNSIAKCNIEPGSNGTYKVNYVPVEVGVYNVIILWNGKPVEGSPFHPVVVDPSKVDVVGGWQSILNGNGCLPLTVHEHNSVAFSTKLAGPGQLTADISCNDAIVPVDVVQTNPDQYTIAFMPRAVGEYLIRVFWGGVPLPRSPLVGLATAPTMNRHRSATPVNSDKVILTGQGLHQAKVNQRADFVIDGTEAGYGSPDVQLIGLNSDVNVQCVPLGGQKYQCFYIAKQPGAYLLNITWANRPVRGSPFKVTIATGSNASRVTCVGDGLSSGVVGQELKTAIDTRRAGSGELSAQCVGPTKMAVCELVDHRDGTFTLYVKPQEAGKHILEIKYGNDHIPGSPFVTKVSGSPDASKVTARGPGLQHGILARYRSHFVVDTAGAGAGQLTVRVRGPKDAFHVEMQRDKQKDRTIICRYDPTEVGDYVVHIKWSGVHVPGSPFHVHIFDTEDELDKFKTDDDYHVFNQHVMATPSPRQFDTLAYTE